MTKIALAVIALTAACGGAPGEPPVTDASPSPPDAQPADARVVDAPIDAPIDSMSDAATGPRLRIEQLGNGVGEITVDGELCPLPCERPVELGSTVRVHAYTPHDLVGWSGACHGRDRLCEIMVTGDVDLAVTFDQGRSWSALVDDFAPHQASFAVSNDLIVAGHDEATDEIVVARYAPAGTVTWRVRFPGGARARVAGLGIGLNSDIFLLVDPGRPLAENTLVLRRLDFFDGAERGAVELARSASIGPPSPIADMTEGLATTPTGGVVIIGREQRDPDRSHFVRAYDGSLAPRWSSAELAPLFDVAVSPTNGTVYVLQDLPNGGDRRSVRRYSAEGAPLTEYVLPLIHDGQGGDETAHGHHCADLEVAGSGRLVAATEDAGSDFYIVTYRVYPTQVQLDNWWTGFIGTSAPKTTTVEINALSEPYFDHPIALQADQDRPEGGVTYFTIVFSSQSTSYFSFRGTRDDGSADLLYADGLAVDSNPMAGAPRRPTAVIGRWVRTSPGGVHRRAHGLVRVW